MSAGRARFPAKPAARRDPHQRLIAVLADHLPADSHLRSSRTTPWASVTFEGVRHEFHYTAGITSEDEARRLSADLAEIEFALTGHFVAEVIGNVEDGGLVLEILTVVED